MPSFKITPAMLQDDQFNPKGLYLAVELTQDHYQANCATVPAGTRGIITSTSSRGSILLIPHASLPNESKVWLDGHQRLLPRGAAYRALGRVFPKGKKPRI